MSVKLIPRSKLEMGGCSWCLVIASSTSSLLTGRRKEGVKPYREIDAAASAGAPPLISHTSPRLSPSLQRGFVLRRGWAASPRDGFQAEGAVFAFLRQGKAGHSLERGAIGL